MCDVTDAWHPPRDRACPRRRRRAEANVAWTRSFYEAVKPYLTDQAFPNLMGQEEIADRVGLAYGSNYDRLARIKARYDPTNFFNANANITPKA